MARVVVRHLVPGKNGDWVYPEHTPSVRRPPETREAALAFALQHSIVDFKVGARGQITQVKHIKGGWMSLEDYYDWGRQNELFKSLLPQIVQGGYRLNSLVYAIEFEVNIGPIGIPLPVGAAMIVLEVLTLIEAYRTGDLKTAAVALLALIAPYGCIIAIYHAYLFIKGILDAIIGGAKGLVQPFTPEGSLGGALAVAYGGSEGTTIVTTPPPYITRDYYIHNFRRIRYSDGVDIGPASREEIGEEIFRG